MSFAPETFFAHTYFEARDKFLSAAAAVGAHVETHVLAHAKGPGGREIAMDCAVLGPQDANAALVVPLFLTICIASAPGWSAKPGQPARYATVFALGFFFSIQALLLVWVCHYKIG